MIEHKAGVRLFGLRPEVFHAVHIAEQVWAAAGAPTLVLTSGTEGQHVKGSGHYRGCAVDLRTNTLPRGVATTVCAQLQKALGPDYFVLYEHAGEANEHCHLEFKPAEAY